MTYFKLSNCLNHQILFHGSRFVVFEVDKNHPYENYEEDCTVLVLDKKHDAIIAWCNKSDDGSFTCDMSFSQASIDVYGKDVKDLIQNIKAKDRWILKQFKN